MPKTREQNQLIKEERRNSILICSLYLFALKGYSSVNIDDVTKAAKCSHGLFYHYFKDKEELFFSVIEEVALKQFIPLINSINYNQKAKFAIHDLLNCLYEILVGNNKNLVCILYLLFNLHLQKDNIPKPKDINKKNNPLLVYWLLIDLIKKGQIEGDINDGNPKVYAVAILSMITGLSFNRLYIGLKRFVCPTPEIIMNILIKK